MSNKINEQGGAGDRLDYLKLWGSVMKEISGDRQCLRKQVDLGTRLVMAGALLTLPLSQAHSQTASPTVAPVTSLDEIIVTAQKRSQSINDVGMAVTAISSDQLREQGIRSVDDLTKIEPSFNVAAAQYGTPVYIIRGVGYNAQSLAAAPAVSVYVDEVPYSYPALTRGATLDLERVEVLKGPQGTLYGQNATGGAINYIAAKPTDEFAAGVEGTYGRFDAKDINAFVSGPLSSTLRARFAVDWVDGGAWQKSYTTGDTIGATRETKARLLLDWTPTDAFHMLVNFNGWSDHSDTPVTQLLEVTPLDPQFLSRVPLLASFPTSPLTPRAADWDPGYVHENDEHFYQGSVRAEYTISDALTITSLTSFEHYNQNNVIGNDGTALDGNSVRQTGSVQTLSQELRAGGTALDKKLNWVFGLDYSKDLVEEYITGFLPYTTPAFALTPLGVPSFSDIAYSSNPSVNTQAVFANAEYAVADTVSVHAGARFTKADIDYDGCLYGIDPNFAGGLNNLQAFIKQGVGVTPITPGGCATFNSDFTPGLQSLSLDQNNVSWRVGADWHPIDRTLVYVSVSKGFKAGSFPTLPATGAIQLTPVTQEQLLAYEVGFKSNLIRNVDFDASVFHYDYRNKQLEGRIVDPTGVFGIIDALVNIPKSEENGAELSVNWRPIGGLTLRIAGTYLDSRVTSVFKTIDVYTGNPTNFEGYEFPNTPRWSATSGAQYEVPFTGELATFVGADFRYQSNSSSVFEDRSDVAAGYPSLENGAYGVLDARVGVERQDHRWRVELYGNNVLNRYYWTDSSRIYDTSVRYPGMTATFGVTGLYRFGKL